MNLVVSLNLIPGMNQIDKNLIGVKVVPTVQIFFLWI
ncbi:hypothetical protein EMIT0P12_20690 [Pseudomonas sp. IT-P12]